jgi:UDP:flavonoid glycosyltransferase YjiC (YdhE family)
MLGVGSRGDVQPLAVLAGALAQRGIDARVVALAEYASVAADLGAGFEPFPGELADALNRTWFVEQLAKQPLGQLAMLRRWVASLAPGLADTLDRLVEPGDTLIAGTLARGAATAFALARQARVATIVYTGQAPTLHPDSHFYGHWLTGFGPYDRWGVDVNWRLATQTGGPLTSAVAHRLGLPAPGARAATRAADAHPVIVAASPTLVPPAPDWPPFVHQTGYLAPPPTPDPTDAALTAFTEGGPAAYVGFGSLATFSTTDELTLIHDAARLSGIPVVTSAPPGVRPGPLSDHLYAVGSVPHAWLFPRMAGIVHHGGAGTTHEALRSGVPSVALPWGVDQPYHGRRLHALGVGPEPVPLHKVTARRLADLLAELTGPGAEGYQRRAREVAEQVRGEDGVGATIGTLERCGLLPL